MWILCSIEATSTWVCKFTICWFILWQTSGFSVGVDRVSCSKYNCVAIIGYEYCLNEAYYPTLDRKLTVSALKGPSIFSMVMSLSNWSNPGCFQTITSVSNVLVKYNLHKVIGFWLYTYLLLAFACCNATEEQLGVHIWEEKLCACWSVGSGIVRLNAYTPVLTNLV